MAKSLPVVGNRLFLDRDFEHGVRDDGTSSDLWRAGPIRLWVAGAGSGCVTKENSALRSAIQLLGTQSLS